MDYILLTVCVLCALMAGVHSQCPEVYVTNTRFGIHDGVYAADGSAMCNSRPVYFNRVSSNYLYHEGGYWYIVPLPCITGLGELSGNARVRSSANYADDIRGQWEQRDNGMWMNSPIDIYCYDEPPESSTDRLPTSVAVGIAFGCFVVLFIIIPMIATCVRTSIMKRRQQQAAEQQQQQQQRMPSVMDSVPQIHPMGNVNFAAELPVESSFIPPAYSELELAPPSYDQVLAEVQHPDLKDMQLPPPYGVQISSDNANIPSAGSQNNTEQTIGNVYETIHEEPEEGDSASYQELSNPDVVNARTESQQL